MYTCRSCGDVNHIDTIGCATCYAPAPMHVGIVAQDQTERRSITLSPAHGGMMEELIHRYYDVNGSVVEERIERRSWVAPAQATPSPTLRAFSATSFQPAELAQPAPPAAIGPASRA